MSRLINSCGDNNTNYHVFCVDLNRKHLTLATVHRLRLIGEMSLRRVFWFGNISNHGFRAYDIMQINCQPGAEKIVFLCYHHFFQFSLVENTNKCIDKTSRDFGKYITDGSWRKFVQFNVLTDLTEVKSVKLLSHREERKSPSQLIAENESAWLKFDRSFFSSYFPFSALKFFQTSTRHTSATNGKRNYEQLASLCSAVENRAAWHLSASTQSICQSSGLGDLLEPLCGKLYLLKAWIPKLPQPLSSKHVYCQYAPFHWSNVRSNLENLE